MPIRDALRQLEAEGLFRFTGARAGMSRGWNSAEIREIYAVRELLESEALRLSTPQLADQKLDEAEHVLGIKIDAEPNVARWGMLNRMFHLALCSACGNARLLALIEAHHNAADRYVRSSVEPQLSQDRSQSEHRQLLAACRRRDSEEAVARFGTSRRRKGDACPGRDGERVDGNPLSLRHPPFGRSAGRPKASRERRPGR